MKPNTTDYQTFHITTNRVLGKPITNRTIPNDLVLNLTKQMHGPYDHEWKIHNALKQSLRKTIQVRNQINANIDHMYRQTYGSNNDALLIQALPIIEQENARLSALDEAIRNLEEYVAYNEQDLNRKTREAWNFVEEWNFGV